MKNRFRGFYPVVVDIETSGFNPKKNALLEVAAVLIELDENGQFVPGLTKTEHVLPFDGSILEPAALEFNKIDPYNPFRMAKKEADALESIFKFVRSGQKKYECSRSVLVGHNAHFDHSFLLAAEARTEVKKNPFHPFTVFDTATLSGLIFGQTVLAKALAAAAIPFDDNEAHSAKYDANVTAQLFCSILNTWHQKSLF